MKSQKGFTVIELIVVIVALFGIWGWIWNIIKLMSLDFSVITSWLVLRVIGIIMPPLGAVLGFL